MSGQSAKTYEDIDAQIAHIQLRRGDDDEAEDNPKENERTGLGDVSELDSYGAIGKKKLGGYNDTNGGDEEEEDDEEGVVPEGGRERVLATPEIFSAIMLKVGLISLDDLYSCRLVCSKWDKDILSLVWGSQGSRRILKEWIERSWGPGMLPSNEDISHARWLESRGILDTVLIQTLSKRVRESLNDRSVFTVAELKCGLLDSVDKLVLSDVDLSTVTAEQLTALVSSVTLCLYIANVSGCHLTSILTSLKCQSLDIRSQIHSLDREGTLALVRAMEYGVKEVTLEELDMEALITYSGKGVCGKVSLWLNDLAASIDEVRTWARRINWSWRVWDEGSLVELIRPEK